MGSEAVRRKLTWASHHLDLLDNAVAEYVNLNNIGFVPERHDQANKLVWGRIESKVGGAGLEVISHMFGDVLQSAHSCLDYLVCELFLLHHPGEEAKRSHQFPIVTSHSAFNDELGGGRLYGIPFEAVAIIEGLQPYKGRTDPVPAQLLALRTLTNTHKHRQIHVSVLTTNPAPSNVVPVKIDGEFRVRVGDLPAATHHKAELGPFRVTDDGDVDVNREFTPVVVLEESGFRGKPIAVVAARFCEAVGESYNRLLPFLS
jgi:hypothetical protein